MGWIVLVVFGLIFSRYLIPIFFSEKYVESIPTFNILLISTIFYFVSIWLLPMINAFDLILYSQIFNLIKALVNTVADFILVPKIGIIGAAYGTLLTYFVGMLLSIILINSHKKKIYGKKSEN
jgi:O-antigen/teichoic acid export membrane protein